MDFTFDRRRFFQAMAAIPCALTGWLVYRQVADHDDSIRTIDARELPPAKSIRMDTSESHLCFHAIGDTGLASENRQSVIRQMLVQSAQHQPDLIFLVGDNFYEAGVESIDDPGWQKHFSIPFPIERFPMPFYACLGNHDYYGNIAAQIEYSLIDQRWRMPAAYYAFTRRIDDATTVDFFVLDTTPIEEGDYSTRAQIKWLREKLESCRADWKIVIGHHPLFTGGEHGRSRRNFRHLVPLFDEFQIDLYICGHDHDLQLHDTERGWLHLVTGSGSKLRSVRWVGTTLFAAAESGFSRIFLTPQKMVIEMFATDGLRFSHETLHSLGSRRGRESSASAPQTDS